MSYVSRSIYGKVLCHGQVHSGCVSNISEPDKNTCKYFMVEIAFHCDIWLLSVESKGKDLYKSYVVNKFQFKKVYTHWL